MCPGITTFPTPTPPGMWTPTDGPVRYDPDVHGAPTSERVVTVDDEGYEIVSEMPATVADGRSLMYLPATVADGAGTGGHSGSVEALASRGVPRRSRRV